MKLIVRTFFLFQVLGIVFFGCKEDEQPLKVLDFEPKLGPQGGTVNIYGRGFSSALDKNKVEFNGVEAEVIEADNSLITAKVPNGASTGKLTVTVGDRMEETDVPFEVVSVKGKWTEMAEFPGTYRSYNVCFSNNEFGFIGLGGDWFGQDPLSTFKDMWKFDPVQNEWIRLNDFPENSRVLYNRPIYNFVVNDKALVITEVTLNDSLRRTHFNLWEYNMAIDEWLLLEEYFPSPYRYGSSVTYMYDSKFIIGPGSDEMGNYVNDLLQYNPDSERWDYLSESPMSDIGGLLVQRDSF